MKWVTTDQGFSEVFTPARMPRPHYGPLVTSIESFTRTEIERRERLQTLSLISQGVTFTISGEKEGLERILPFDFVPRIITAAEGGPLTPACRIVGRLHADLDYRDEAFTTRTDPMPLLEHVVTELIRAHDALSAQFFEA